MESASSAKRSAWWNRGSEPRRPSLFDHHVNVANGEANSMTSIILKFSDSRVATSLWSAKDGILKIETSDLSKREKKQLIDGMTLSTSS
jgi:hypothetical protein